jgi:aminoglycoside phosphotransferase (APT) family kinase protein
VPDRRLDRFAVLYDDMLGLAEPMTRLAKDPLTADEMARLVTRRAAVAEWAERLVLMGLPETIQHDDLHDRNVFLSDGHARIFDWGDASIGHPLLTLRESLMSVAEALGLDYMERPTGLDPFRDAYFEPWLELVPMQSLLAARAHEAAGDHPAPSHLGYGDE